MTKTTTIELDHITELLEKRDFKNALAKLSAFRPNRGKLELRELAELYYLESKCWYFLGEYDKALIKLKVSIKLGDYTNDNVAYAQRKFHLGRIYQQIDRISDAIEAYNESYVFFKRTKQSRLMCESLNSIAGAHFLKGNLRESRDVLKTIIKQTKSLGFIEEAPIYKLNLCKVLVLMGSINECLQVLHAIHFDKLNQQAQVLLLNLKALIDVSKFDFSTAATNLAQNMILCKKYSSTRDEIVCLEYLGLNEYFAGNYEKAKEYYLDILGRDEITASASAQTLRMLTDVYIVQEEWGKAIETARKAEAAITRINERIELGALYRAYGQICAHDDNVGHVLSGHDVKPQEGLTYKNNKPDAHDYFQKSITLLREIGARYELALTYMTCGRSLVYTNEERLDHLRRARDLFVEMEVPKRVAQVEQEIEVVGRVPSAVRQSPDETRNPTTFSRNDNSDGASVIIAHSSRMREIISMADRIKDSDMTILLTGETGTGKDLMAEYIHKTSCRREKPFVSVNSAAIPEALLESELFGFRKGTYTGATTDKTGLIETADGGTFYFDEIGEIPQSIQVKLLRVLETKAVRPLGVTRSKVIDVRFIAATNLDLHQKMASGHFRRDLFYRLQEFMIDLPPLDQRRDDFPHLVRHFIGERFPLSVTDMAKLLASFNGYSWPGNIRELKAALGRSLALWDGGDISDLISCFGSLNPQIIQQPTEREQMIVVLDRNNGNIAKASRELGLPDSTLRYQLKKLGI